ncbi:rho GTPase-activating protein SYDE1 isoform X1 [Corythoichthys intestinalis]|uniref:rho GTPase-activating protein SYDE1 isoform X1 n=1 Tax=Corythoichthys intestinalis TaxID=161448 RepID=UPI0025A50759|nr:rho GTPase-activating protein SYDE1 isoform X1 [Corythoichthys intestinalis]XP_057681299.1 rho GTPase-activating protein SYDE1 isoform X1 [Corythoichthys intestinalis]XP_057681301.1 rho GTPase-activating protein SYDE1 isoform X1 [Corythoichthys intestinalis]
MAQPLLKRTFSRLRGKDRSRRKTEPEDAAVRRSGSPSPPMTRKSPEAEPPPLGRVTKRQRWQGRESPDAWPNSGADGNGSTRDGVAEGSFRSDGSNGTPVLRPSTQRSAPRPAGDEPSVARAYLQSLDRSSRAWVLSSGKSEASDEARGRRESGGHIWYNPIPEEERPAARAGSRKESGPGLAETSAEKDGVPSEVVAAVTEDPDSRTAVPKRGGVMDRLRSPGTVRKLSLKMKKLPELGRKLSLRSSRVGQGSDGTGGAAKTAPDRNVISRYHLDSSAPPAGRSPIGRAASKGGYLSDGDSPDRSPGDSGSFPLYRAPEASRRCRRTTGLLTVHLLGLDQIQTKPSDAGKEIFLAIQIDGTTRARTSLLSLRGGGVSLNHTFRLELERARLLRVVVLTPARPESDRLKNTVCCLGGVAIPPLFKGSRCQQLCVKLEPGGLLYIKLSLREEWDAQFAGNSAAPSNVFGVELRHLVEEEGSVSAVPLLIQKTVAEIERRGLKAVGLYRLCGSAAVKKELRDRFERDSSAVRLGEDLYPDINVITGILKDYLRELPSSLITATLYEAVKEAMTRRPPPVPPGDPDPRLAESTVALLTCLPAAERATLTLLLEHLSLVAHFSSRNRMTHQNLAVCFGPVLLKARREGPRGGRPGEDWPGAVDFKRHVEALHYLLRSWPVPVDRIPAEEAAVSRRGRDGAGRPDSPPPVNRYAGDWSVRGRHFPSGREADYDEVEGSDRGGQDEKKEAWFDGGSEALYAEDLDAPFNCRLSLKDFDRLIGDLDRELAKGINICT